MGLVELDQVLGLTKLAIVDLAEPLGRLPLDRGDDGADVHALNARLDAGNDQARDGLALGGVTRLAMLPVRDEAALGPEYGTQVPRLQIAGRDLPQRAWKVAFSPLQCNRRTSRLKLPNHSVYRIL